MSFSPFAANDSVGLRRDTDRPEAERSKGDLEQAAEPDLWRRITGN